MGRFTQYVLARNYPPRLVYRDGESLILEVARGEGSFLKWVFQARKDGPSGKRITLAGTYGSRSSLFETMFEHGFIPDDGPAQKVMAHIQRIGFAASSIVKRKR